MGFFGQEYQSEPPFPPPGDILDPGIEASSPVSPALQVDSLPAEPSGKPLVCLLLLLLSRFSCIRLCVTP